MPSISTSSARSADGRGFTLLELVLGLTMAMVIATAVAPLWLSLEKSAVGEADRTVSFVQGQVAAARFERDLRLASARNSPFATTCPVLQASPSQVVFLEGTTDDSAPTIVEWELVKGTLMRRVGPCPSTRPSAFSHALYSDSKTMLEQVEVGSQLAYQVNGALVPGPVDAEDLGSVDGVVLQVVTKPADSVGEAVTTSNARVGR